jgi:hypothetical protein
VNIEASAAAADTVRAPLVAAAGDLRYMSEADNPFDFVTFPSATAADLSPERFAALVGKPGAHVEEVTLDRFFAGMIERADPADAVSVALVPRFQALKNTLRATLPDLRVFRVGEVTLECYVVGTAPGGGLAGLHTQALET